jgi:hypothetical protein
MSTDSPEKSHTVAGAVALAQAFLEPAFRQRDSSKSITEKIATASASPSDTEIDDEARREVILKGCRLFISIHDAVSADQERPGSKPSYDSNLLGVVYNLLDLLILEGVYPQLPAGIGSPVERRAKSLLYSKPDPVYTPPKSLGVIGFVLKDTLNSIAANFDVGIEPMQRHRVLIDLIAGNAYLAHSEGALPIGTNQNTYLDR